MMKRAKWSVSNSANGNRALFGSTCPGPRFIESSNCRSSVSRSAMIGASTMKFDCGVIVFWNSSRGSDCLVERSETSLIYGMKDHFMNDQILRFAQNEITTGLLIEYFI